MFDMNIEEGKKKSLCLYPFFNSMITASGHYKPCCKFNGHLAHNGSLLQAPEHTLADAWHSSDVTLLRQQLLRNEKPAGCQVCWDEEQQGIPSMRFDSFNYGFTETQINTPTSPLRLDLYPSNICNLKCRICSPHYSSKWIQEGKETLGINEQIHLNLTGGNFDLLKQWLPQMVEIGLFGGEPLYMKETIAILEYCAAQNLSQNITLLINTNGTIYSDRIMALFKSFKRVVLNFSIDDIGPRFEYQRKNADWNEVAQNLKAYLSNGGGLTYGNQIEVKICTTVSMFNIYYLPELLTWLEENFAGIQTYLNMLHGPYQLSVKNFPAGVKAAIEQKLKAANSTNTIRTLTDVIEFLHLPPNLPFEHCLAEIKRGDTYRNEKFEEVFSELNTVLTRVA
jgi:molybdenum cofactor biosynthesis enzyme MoaA